MRQYGDNRTGIPPGQTQRSVGGLARALQTTQGDSLARFADSWLSRLLIGAVVLLLIVMFPLDWLRAPTLLVKASNTVFAPRPGAAASTDGSAAPGTITAGYDLSEAATVAANVHDGNNSLVRTL